MPLSQEQEDAVRHLTDDKQLSCLIGVAGAGKSTILNAARQAWEASGRKVVGAALAGKAAKGLEQSSGIQSRTLGSFELAWQNEVNQLQRGDVFVVDEAGMIGSQQMARFVNEAKDKGVKLVLIGDAEQLQPIEAGAPFRAITERMDTAKLSNVHRQKDDWQKQASQDFAHERTVQALNAYRDNDRVEFLENREDAIQSLVSDYLNDFWTSDGQGSQLALAHRKADVKAINQSIREARKEAGELEDAVRYQTSKGSREFASGDRLLFTRNDKETGVQNGMLGTVIRTKDKKLTISLDDRNDDGSTRFLTISTDQYNEIDHGYATTIHKSQGATVDRSYILTSQTMNRHLTYVAVTRHKQETKLYADKEEFRSFGHLSKRLSRDGAKKMSTDFAPVERVKSKIIQLGQSFTEAKPRSRSYLDDIIASPNSINETSPALESSSNKDDMRQRIMDRLRQDRNNRPFKRPDLER